MEALGPARNFTEVPLWQHGGSAFEVITDYFLPSLDGLGIPLGEAAILAPTWFSLFPLGRRLREYGISIVGPGARLYRRNRQFAPLAEQVCGYLMEPRPDAIAGIERTLFNTLLDVTGRANFDIFSYHGRLVVFRLLERALQLHETYISGIAWLKAAASAFSEVLLDEEYLSRSELDIFAMSVEEMKADMRNNRVDLENLTIDELGIYASPDAALKLSTLHNAKGREYLAVAMIDLHEGRIPFYQAQTAEEIEEAKHLFYVGVTRARRFLLYVTDDSDRRNGPSRFLLVGTGARSRSSGGRPPLLRVQQSAREPARATPLSLRSVRHRRRHFGPPIRRLAAIASSPARAPCGRAFGGRTDSQDRASPLHDALG
jgi:DNA helicase-2/ATP-dependent DNA helicase PcrA